MAAPRTEISTGLRRMKSGFLVGERVSPRFRPTDSQLYGEIHLQRRKETPQQAEARKQQDLAETRKSFEALTGKQHAPQR